MLKDLELHGSLLIEADDVTLDNVKVVSRDYWPVRITGSGATLEDTTIIGGKESQASLAGPFVGRRLDLSGAPDGIKMTDGGELYDSYIHDLGELDGAHNDAIDASGPVEIVHNTILNQVGQTSAIFLSDYGEDPDTHVLIQDNLLGGGGYSIYGGAPDTAQGHRVVDNLFTTRFFPRSGYWGPVAYWRARGNTWSNNRWADGPEAGDLVAP